MFSADSQGIVCPRCQAILLSRRRSCPQCGEPIAAPNTVESPKDGPTCALPDYYGFSVAELRRIPRKEVAIRGTVYGQDGSVGWEILIENLCENGALFRCNESFQEGHRVRIRLPLDGREFSISGIVRRMTRTLNSAGAFACGLEFFQPDPALRSAISALPSDDSTPYSGRLLAA